MDILCGAMIMFITNRDVRRTPWEIIMANPIAIGSMWLKNNKNKHMKKIFTRLLAKGSVGFGISPSITFVIANTDVFPIVLL